MATPLSDGRIYLIEEDTENLWVPTPGSIDLDKYIQGDEYCSLEIPKRWIKKGVTGIKVEIASGGDGFMTRTYRRGYMVQVQSNEMIGANAHYIDEFIMNNRHTATSSSTFTDYYLVICRDEDGANGFEMFTNASGTQVGYLKGVVSEYQITWIEGQNLRANVQFTFIGAW